MIRNEKEHWFSFLTGKFNKNRQVLEWTIQQRKIELYNKPLFSVSAEICGIKIIKNESD